MPLFRGPWPTPVADPPRDPDTRHATDLLNAAMAYARLILRRYGQLAPFAFSIDREGQVSRETMEIPRLPRDAERLFRLLTDHIAERIRRGRIQGVAVCANVSLATPSQEGYTDAVDLRIEQESGHAVQVTVPYKMYGGHLHNLLPRRISMGQLVSEETQPQLFAHRH
ncbi:MAG: hypothetical protein ACLGXA_16370 [Acidobacteriota bacterium]